MTIKTIRAGVIGATGYTGVELLRLLAHHPHVALHAITSRGEAGVSISDRFPWLRGAASTILEGDLYFSENS